MERGGDGDDAAAGAGCVGGFAVGGVFLCGGDDVRHGGFHCVVGAEDVDFDYGAEGVGGELLHWGEEVTCCAGAGGGGVLEWRG